MSDSLTFRDRVKFACLSACIEAGLDEQQMIDSLQSATRALRSPQYKTALSPTQLLNATGVAAVGLPFAATLLAAGLGNVAGKAVKNVEVGRLPSTDELKLLDEVAAYDRTTDEINLRLKEQEKERARKAKPSVRQIF